MIQQPHPDAGITVEAFSGWCVPNACAALAQCRPDAPARLILARQRLRGVITAPGASNEDGAAALLALGCMVEAFDLPDMDCPALDCDALRATLDALHEQARPCRKPEADPGWNPAEMAADFDMTPEQIEACRLRAARGRTEGMPLFGDWLRNAPAGAWLVAVEHPDEPWTHAIAVRDGQPIAGHAPTFDGWHVSRRLYRAESRG